MIRRMTGLFPLWAILFSLAAYECPSVFILLKSAIVPLLGVVMLGMGMTLTWADFRDVFKRPKLIFIGVALQYLIMPFLAWFISMMLQLSPVLAAGLVLVGCCPGGTASNVICYLSRANVALSITLTFASTLMSFILTPVLTWMYIGATVPVPVADMLISILKIVILPVVLGVLINTVWGIRMHKVKDVFPLVSVFAIVIIIAIIVALNKDHLQQAGGVVFLAVILHNFFGITGGYAAAKLMNLDERDARTMAVEVGMQNSDLVLPWRSNIFRP